MLVRHCNVSTTGCVIKQNPSKFPQFQCSWTTGFTFTRLPSQLLLLNIFATPSFSILFSVLPGNISKSLIKSLNGSIKIVTGYNEWSYYRDRCPAFPGPHPRLSFLLLWPVVSCLHGRLPFQGKDCAIVFWEPPRIARGAQVIITIINSVVEDGIWLLDPFLGGGAFMLRYVAMLQHILALGKHRADGLFLSF